MDPGGSAFTFTRLLPASKIFAYQSMLNNFFAEYLETGFINTYTFLVNLSFHCKEGLSECLKFAHPVDVNSETLFAARRPFSDRIHELSIYSEHALCILHGHLSEEFLIVERVLTLRRNWNHSRALLNGIACLRVLGV